MPVRTISFSYLRTISSTSLLLPWLFSAFTMGISGATPGHSLISQSISGWFPVTGQNTAAVVSPAFFAAVKMSGTFTNLCSKTQSYLPGSSFSRLPKMPVLPGRQPVAIDVCAAYVTDGYTEHMLSVFAPPITYLR